MIKTSFIADIQTIKYNIFLDAFALAAVNLNEKWGWINRTGKKMVAFKYDYPGHFQDGFAKVELRTKISEKLTTENRGKFIISQKYGRYTEIREKQTRIMYYIEYGIINREGQEIVACKYDDCDSLFYEGLVRVKLDGRWGFIDKMGQEIIPCKYDDARIFIKGLASIELNGQWGFIDTLGKEIIPCKYDSVCYFSDGYARVKKNGKWGCIDSKGYEVAICKYDFIDKFRNQLAIVVFTGKCGFIDKTFKEIIPCKYEMADYFHDGLAWVKLDGKWITIDRMGKEISSSFEVVNDIGVISVFDFEFEGRFKNENGYYISVRDKKGDIQQINIVNGCPAGVYCYNIRQLRATKDIGEIRAGSVFLNAYGHVIEEDED